jgi:hypothetical protein
MCDMALVLLIVFYCSLALSVRAFPPGLVHLFVACFLIAQYQLITSISGDLRSVSQWAASPTGSSGFFLKERPTDIPVVVEEGWSVVRRGLWVWGPWAFENFSLPEANLLSFHRQRRKFF